MEKDQSLQDLIKAEPKQWVNAVMKLDSLQDLSARLSRTRSEHRKIIIEARIDNINYLAT